VANRGDTLTTRVPLQRTDPTVILDAVEDLLESDGLDKWQLRDVAEIAKVSLATIYKHFPSRDDLILATIERWMDEHVYKPIRERAPGEPLFDALMRMFRTIFKPWEQHPMMLDAFVRASSLNGGERLFAQGVESVRPMAKAFDGLHPSDVADLSEILTNVTFGAMSRYVVGDLPVSGILPAIERTLSWLKEPPESIAHQGEKSPQPRARSRAGRPTRSRS
jgi:TetR/AcrR family transcriptional regulator, cholesterol catabolism regulator